MPPVSCFFRSKTGFWSLFILLSVLLDINLIALLDWAKCLEPEIFAVYFLILEILFFAKKIKNLEIEETYFTLSIRNILYFSSSELKI